MAHPSEKRPGHCQLLLDLGRATGTSTGDLEAVPRSLPGTGRAWSVRGVEADLSGTHVSESHSPGSRETGLARATRKLQERALPGCRKAATTASAVQDKLLGP